HPLGTRESAKTVCRVRVRRLGFRPPDRLAHESDHPIPLRSWRNARKEAPRVTLSRRLERTTSSLELCLCFATRGAYRFAQRRRRASDEWSWCRQAPAKSLLHKLRRSRRCWSCALRDLLFQSDRLTLRGESAPRCEQVRPQTTGTQKPSLAETSRSEGLCRQVPERQSRDSDQIFGLREGRGWSDLP